MDDDIDFSKFSRRERLIASQMCLKRFAELLRDKMQKDIDRFESLDLPDQLYIYAYWAECMDRVFTGALPEPIAVPTYIWEEFHEEVRVIDEYYGLGVTTIEKAAPDVKKRLESVKRLVADRFANDFRRIVNHHEITSPIEQVFLMEWKSSGVESRHLIDLLPQQDVDTEVGTFCVDYLVVPRNGSAWKIVVELDGHEFHERTKEQVEKDNQRCRALQRTGLTVLRFSGREIMRNSKKCVDEVIAMVVKAS